MNRTFEDLAAAFRRVSSRNAGRTPVQPPRPDRSRARVGAARHNRARAGPPSSDHRSGGQHTAPGARADAWPPADRRPRGVPLRPDGGCPTAGGGGGRGGARPDPGVVVLRRPARPQRRDVWRERTRAPARAHRQPTSGSASSGLRARGVLDMFALGRTPRARSVVDGLRRLVAERWGRDECDDLSGAEERRSLLRTYLTITYVERPVRIPVPAAGPGAIVSARR